MIVAVRNAKALRRSIFEVPKRVECIWFDPTYVYVVTKLFKSLDKHPVRKGRLMQNSVREKESANTDGEISILAILAKLWRFRGVIVAATALAFLSGLALFAFSGYSTPQTITYFISLNNIENSKYPNGAAFQPSDLVSPQVLQHLRNTLSLPEAVSLKDNIRISYDGVATEGIQKIYRDRLGAKNLSQAEIESINRTFADEIESATKNSLRIDVNFTSMNLDTKSGVEIAKQIPVSWTEVFTKQFRTLVTQEISSAITPFSMNDFQNVNGILTINSNMEIMRRGLAAIDEDSRLNSVQDLKGNSAADIIQGLDLYRNLYFNRLFSSILSDGSVVGKVYVKAQQLRIDQLNQQIEGLDKAFEKLQAGGNNQVGVALNDSQMSAQQPTVQMDSNALNQIIGLSEKASNAEYLREILTKRQASINEISDIKRQIALIEPSSELQVSDSAYIEQAYQGLTSIANSYNELLTAARSLAEDRSGALYQSLTTPMKSGNLLNLRMLLIPFGLGILGFVFSALYSLIWLEGKSR